MWARWVQINQVDKIWQVKSAGGELSGICRLGGLDSLWWVLNYVLATPTQQLLAILVL